MLGDNHTAPASSARGLGTTSEAPYQGPAGFGANSWNPLPFTVQAWHESLTPAQETVCRWIWEKCAKYSEPWEKFEFGFLCEYNVNHELVSWTRIALVFSEFVERHRSLDKRLVLSELCALSTGIPPRRLKPGRAKELMELWKEPPAG